MLKVLSLPSDQCLSVVLQHCLQDELVVALPDIRPAAAQHLLVLPREHIPNISSLTAADAQLGEDAATVQCSAVQT
jgi:diadenosine tetraphosphate (Ap4A) HIT family hydrolase